MSKFTRAFVLTVAAGFFLIAILAFVKGDYGVAVAALVFALVVAFIGALGWFERRFPLPPLPAGHQPSLLGEARRYWQHYRGWPGKVAVVVAVGLVLSAAGRSLLG